MGSLWQRTSSPRRHSWSPPWHAQKATRRRLRWRKRIGTRAEALSISNDTVFTAATEQLVAAATGEDDGRCLEDALGDAASAPRMICETARDLALLADALAHTCDGVRRADYVGIAHLSAAAASTALELVRSNLVIGDDDLRLATASSATAEAAHAALRASSTGA